MNKLAFLYPGQGSQKTGMGKDFYDKDAGVRGFYQEAGRLLNLNMEELCFENNTLLDQTEYTQAALVTTCLAITGCLKEREIFPEATAGLSLGEYAAIAAAGGCDNLDAVKLVRKRGILMQNAVPLGKGAMYAVLSMPCEEIEKIIQPISEVKIANYNCPGQTVITGRTEKVIEAAELLKKSGAPKVIRLNVSGSFHSPMMQSAGEELEKELMKIQWKKLEIPYYTNVNAQRIECIQKAPELLKKQISEPVCWMQCMEQMIQDGIDTFIEIGPGRTLTGFLRKINRNVKIYSVAGWEEMEQTVAALGKEL